MSDKKPALASEFETTKLLIIDPKKSTLPVDTSAEWTKGFMLINKLIKLLADATYTEKIYDDYGEGHEKPVLHPQLLGYLQERRHMIDQIWKISGGEVINEGKKEIAKNLARAMFEIQQDGEIKDKYRQEAIKIIEIEEDES